jgi:Kef-type K+ transport system membrane component KefB
VENIGKILFGLLMMFTAAKIMGEIFARIKQPAVIGEILAGIILGPFVFGLINPANPEAFGIYKVLAEIGVIILLFTIGLQTRVDEIIKVGGTSLVVATLGVILPFFFGYLYTLTTEHSTVEAMFIGAAMVATSVGITARVLSDLGILDSRVAKVILGAAIIDDILGLLVLAVVTGMGKGTISYVKIALITLEAAGFVAFIVIIGKRLVIRVAPRLYLGHRVLPGSLGGGKLHRPGCHSGGVHGWNGPGGAEHRIQFLFEVRIPVRFFSPVLFRGDGEPGGPFGLHPFQPDRLGLDLDRFRHTG